MWSAPPPPSHAQTEDGDALVKGGGDAMAARTKTGQGNGPTTMHGAFSRGGGRRNYMYGRGARRLVALDVPVQNKTQAREGGWATGVSTATLWKALSTGPLAAHNGAPLERPEGWGGGGGPTKAGWLRCSPTSVQCLVTVCSAWCSVPLCRLQDLRIEHTPVPYSTRGRTAPSCSFTFGLMAPPSTQVNAYLYISSRGALNSHRMGTLLSHTTHTGWAAKAGEPLKLLLHFHTVAHALAAGQMLVLGLNTYNDLYASPSYKPYTVQVLYDRAHAPVLNVPFGADFFVRDDGLTAAAPSLPPRGRAVRVSVSGIGLMVLMGGLLGAVVTLRRRRWLLRGQASSAGAPGVVVHGVAALDAPGYTALTGLSY